MWGHRFIFMMTILLISIASAKADPPTGIGILGDSYSDEYQFYSPDRSTARNWVEILAETRGLNFGRFLTSSRGEPRNQGFEYNWARSDATTDDLIETGQHTGLARQVARGEVEVVILFIGGNDYINAIKSADPERALAEVAPRSIRNVREVIDVILTASDQVRLIVGTLPDIRLLPEIARAIELGKVSAQTAEAFSAAMCQFDKEIRALATGHPRIGLVDLDLAVRLLNLVDRQTVSVAGFKLDRQQPGNDLGHFFLSDGRHPGTVGQGVLALAILETLNYRFKMGIEPLTHREILDYARSLSSRGQFYAARKPDRGSGAIPLATSTESEPSSP